METSRAQVQETDPESQDLLHEDNVDKGGCLTRPFTVVITGVLVAAVLVVVVLGLTGVFKGERAESTGTTKNQTSSTEQPLVAPDAPAIESRPAVITISDPRYMCDVSLVDDGRAHPWTTETRVVDLPLAAINRIIGEDREPRIGERREFVYVGSPNTLKSPAMLDTVTGTLRVLRRRGCRIIIGNAQQGKGNAQFEELAANIGAEFVDMEELSLSGDAGRYGMLLVPGGPGAQFEATNFRAAGAEVIALFDSSAQLLDPDWYRLTVEESRADQADWMERNHKVAWESRPRLGAAVPAHQQARRPSQDRPALSLSDQPHDGSRQDYLPTSACGRFQSPEIALSIRRELAGGQPTRDSGDAGAELHKD